MIKYMIFMSILNTVWSAPATRFRRDIIAEIKNNVEDSGFTIKSYTKINLNEFCLDKIADQYLNVYTDVGNSGCDDFVGGSIKKSNLEMGKTKMTLGACLHEGQKICQDFQLLSNYCYSTTESTFCTAKKSSDLPYKDENTDLDFKFSKNEIERNEVKQDQNIVNDQSDYKKVDKVQGQVNAVKQDQNIDKIDGDRNEYIQYVIMILTSLLSWWKHNQNSNSQSNTQKDMEKMGKNIELMESKLGNEVVDLIEKKVGTKMYFDRETIEVERCINCSP